MEVFNELRKTLENQALQAATALGFTVIFDDDDPPANGQTYVHMWYETGNTYAKLGGGRKGWECTPGLWHFNVYTPEKKPVAPAVRLCDQLKQRLNRQQWQVPPDGFLKLDPMSIQRQPITKNGFRIVWARCTFDYDHRDSGAAPFSE